MYQHIITSIFISDVLGLGWTLVVGLLETPWDKELDDQLQPRYGINERWLYYRNFKGYNNWRVVNLATTNIATEDEEKIYETILHGIEARMNERILIGTFGAMRTDDEATQGYYLIKWITEPYTIQEDILMKGVEPPQTAFDTILKFPQIQI